MAAAGLGDDLLLANEVVDPARLARARRGAGHGRRDHGGGRLDRDGRPAAPAGSRRCSSTSTSGCPAAAVRPDEAGRLAELARVRGLEVRGVMGYEGHLMVIDDRDEQRARVDDAVAPVRGTRGASAATSSAPAAPAPTTCTRTGVTEVQAGSYALMDTPLRGARPPVRAGLQRLGTVISAVAAIRRRRRRAEGDGHGPRQPHVETSTAGAACGSCSDEHVTFAAARPGRAPPSATGSRVLPAHIDPTMAMHEEAWLVRGDEVVERWPIDLRGW